VVRINVYNSTTLFCTKLFLGIKRNVHCLLVFCYFLFFCFVFIYSVSLSRTVDLCCYCPIPGVTIRLLKITAFHTENDSL